MAIIPATAPAFAIQHVADCPKIAGEDEVAQRSLCFVEKLVVRVFERFGNGRMAIGVVVDHVAMAAEHTSRFSFDAAGRFDGLDDLFWRELCGQTDLLRFCRAMRAGC